MMEDFIGVPEAEACLDGDVWACGELTAIYFSMPNLAVSGGRLMVGAVEGAEAAEDARRFGRTLWSMDKFRRGEVIEEILGHNTPYAYDVVDRWEAATGVATSIKSIDTTAPSYQNTRALQSAIDGYTDKIATFPGKLKVV